MKRIIGVILALVCLSAVLAADAVAEVQSNGRVDQFQSGATRGARGSAGGYNGNVKVDPATVAAGNSRDAAVYLEVGGPAGSGSFARIGLLSTATSNAVRPRCAGTSHSIYLFAEMYDGSATSIHCALLALVGSPSDGWLHNYDEVWRIQSCHNQSDLCFYVSNVLKISWAIPAGLDFTDYFAMSGWETQLQCDGAQCDPWVNGTAFRDSFGVGNPGVADKTPWQTTQQGSDCGCATWTNKTNANTSTFENVTHSACWFEQGIGTTISDPKHWFVYNNNGQSIPASC